MASFGLKIRLPTQAEPFLPRGDGADGTEVRQNGGRIPRFFRLLAAGPVRRAMKRLTSELAKPTISVLAAVVRTFTNMRPCELKCVNLTAGSAVKSRCQFRRHKTQVVPADGEAAIN